jgi:hypothetical protein
MRHRGKIILLAGLGALGLNIAGPFSHAEEGRHQTWVTALLYVQLALLAVVVLLTVTELAKLVRRTFEDTRSNHPPGNAD